MLTPINIIRDIYTQVFCLHTQFQRSAIWIGGDANLSDIEWDRTAVNGNSYNHVTVLDTSSEQVVRFPTRGNNILDVYITNRPSLIYSLTILQV